MSVAFDSNVDLTVEIGFASNPYDTSYTYTDVSAYVLKIDIKRDIKNISKYLKSILTPVAFGILIIQIDIKLTTNKKNIIRTNNKNESL